MRISTNAISSNSVYDIQAASERLFNAQQAISSGKRLTQLSDDPASLPDDLKLHSAIDNLTQYQKNLDNARAFLGSSDVAVGNAITLIRNARTLAIQGSSDGVSSGNRQILSNQVDGLVTALATVANSQYGSRYLFGGQQTTQPPFVLQNGAYVYRGGTKETGDANLQVDIAPNQPVTINQPGGELFNAAFKALTDLKQNLEYGTPAAVSGDNIPALDSVLNTLTASQAGFGAKENQLQATSDRYASQQTDFATYLSNIEDADIPRSIVNLNTAQTAYQAALTASSRNFQQSLLDFLK